MTKSQMSLEFENVSTSTEFLFRCLVLLAFQLIWPSGISWANLRCDRSANITSDFMTLDMRIELHRPWGRIALTDVGERELRCGRGVDNFSLTV
jgi:hypothetical protein